jgi:hypothetical protein
MPPAANSSKLTVEGACLLLASAWDLVKMPEAGHDQRAEKMYHNVLFPRVEAQPPGHESRS